MSKWARHSESRYRIDAMVYLAESESGIPVLPNELDTGPQLLNCENGTIDLRTRLLRQHRRQDLITKLVPVLYDLAATCPKFDRFLAHIMAEDDDLTGSLQRAIGYSLKGDVSEQVLFIPYGTGANGKSTLFKMLIGMLGEVGWEKWTPKSDKLERRRCQDC